MNTLRIYFSNFWRDSSSPCPWAVCSENGSVLDSGTSPLSAMPKGHQCIGIVAADKVLNIPARTPPGSRRRWLGALPFVVEDQTLPDPEDNHVVPGAALNDGQMMLSVIDKSWLQRVIEACQTAKISLRRMIPETFLPTLLPNSWALVWQGNGGFVRTGPNSGISLDMGDAQHAPLALRLQINASSETLPEKITVFTSNDCDTPSWTNMPIPLSPMGPWDWRRVTIPHDALNLLWGEFAPRARLSEWSIKLRPIAYVLLAALAIEVVGSNLEWIKLAHEKNQLSEEMKRNFRSAFGDVTIVDPPLQMRRNLIDLRHRAGLPDQNDFLPLLDRTASALADLPTGSISAIHYETGRLDLTVKLAQRELLNPLRKKLENKGLKIKIDDTHEMGNEVEAKLQVTL